MTLRPVEDVRLRVPPQGCWTPYDLPALCQVPHCREPWVHRHHLCPRSQTAGAVRYVSIDQLVLPNVCGLCLRHHEHVTGVVGGHFARVRVPTRDELEAGIFTALWWLWYTRAAPPSGASQEVDWELLGPLDPFVLI